MFAQMDLREIAAFAVENLDYSADYEMDEGVFEVRGQRFYFERKRNHFVLHVGNKRHKLPRS